jgi:hypothetical protein
MIDNISFKSSHIALSEALLPKMSIKINGMYSIPPHWKDASFNKSLRLFNKNLPVKSEYICPFIKDKTVVEEIPMLRVFVKEILFLFILSLVLLIIGIILIFSKFISWLKYPFLTHIILLINAFTYVFIGSGCEVNLLPELSLIKTYLPFSIFYHADIVHLVSNFIYFLIVSILAESWLNLKSNKKFFSYYFSPFLVNAVLDSYPIVSYGFIPMGLSFVIIWLTINIWMYILKNWEQLLKKRVDVFMLLFSGIPMFSLINWTLYLLLGEQIVGAFNIFLALSHVAIGAFWLLIIIICIIVKKIFKFF